MWYIYHKEEGRKWKNVNTEQGRAVYRKLNNELRKEMDRTRAKWWERQYCELEEMEEKEIRAQLLEGESALTQS